MPRPHRTKSFTIQSSLPATSAPDSVMRRILDPSTWPQWQSEIVSADGPQPIEKSDVVEGRARLLGFDVRGRSTAIEVSPSVFEEDVIVGVRMRVRYSVVPKGDGAIITHRMEAELPAGPAGRLLSLFLAWRLRKMQVELLRRLSDQAEGAPS